MKFNWFRKKKKVYRYSPLDKRIMERASKIPRWIPVSISDERFKRNQLERSIEDFEDRYLFRPNGYFNKSEWVYE